MKNYWLLKTEPEEYSWGDLEKEGQTTWSGVRAYKALDNLARMHPEDLIFIYHTGKERAIVGIARVISFPYPDPGQESGRYLVVNVAALKPLPAPVTLKQVKDSGRFPDWDLVRLPRLSVMPVTIEQWDQVIEWSFRNLAGKGI